MTKCDNAIRGYFLDNRPNFETTDVNTAAEDLHHSFPSLSIDDLEERLWNIGMEMGMNITRRSKPFGQS